MAAFIDQLTHKGHILEFTGESYRHRLTQTFLDNGTSPSETN